MLSVNGALLSAPFFTFSSCLLILLFIHSLLYTSWHTLFVSHSFLSSIQCDSYLRDFIHLFFWHVRLYCRNFFSPYLLVYTVLLFLSARVLCMLVTFIFLLFVTRNVMFLALTWFNFFLVFFLLRALSNLFLSAICYHHCDFYNYVLTSFQNNATFTSILMWITIGHYWAKTKHWVITSNPIFYHIISI